MKFAKYVIRVNNMSESCQQAPILESRVESLEQGLNTKVSQKEFDMFKGSIENWNKVFVAIIFAIVSAVAGLYIFYWTGVNEMKVDIAVIKNQVANISKVLENAEIQK